MFRQAQHDLVLTLISILNTYQFAAAIIYHKLKIGCS